MAEAFDNVGIFHQNMQDAGFSEDVIEKCMFFVKERKTEEIKELLSIHKHTLLDKIHRHQKEIDCLDFLIYKVDKNEY